MNPVTSPLRILPALPDLLPADLSPARPENGAAQPGSFSATLRDAIAEVDLTQSRADNVVRGVLQGTGEDVHKAVIAVEKADLSFQLMLQIRNKLIAAYQEVERLQF